MSIRYFMHIFTLSPQGIWRRVNKRAWQLARRVQVKINGASLAKINCRKNLVSCISNKDDLIKHIKEGSSQLFFVDDQKKEWMAQQFRELCPGEDKNVIQAADLACQHVFDLLGSGPCALGDEIDWQLDFKSGHRWDEKSFYLDLHPAPYPGGYDIKIPWELSRCQHFAWLGQAYWLTGDESYARKFCVQVEHWIASNPPQMGVNWVCTMDVGIRAVNWLWGFAYFRHSAALSNEFHILFYRAMLDHGRHIMHNLEYSETLTTNHYLSNVVGLVYLGLLLPELKEAKAWREFGLRELEAEMFKQVYPDGVVFEASTNYHRLTTELFLSATMIAQMNGEKFSTEYIIRLERMIDAISKLTRPDGTMPVIGDQDNGRLHRLKVWGNPIQEWRDFCPLVAAGSAWMQKPVGLLFASSDWAEAFWLAGPEAVRQTQQTARDSASLPTGSVLLPDGGWAVMRDQDRYLMMDVGPVGQNEEGGHTHNDSLSIDVFADGQAWIVDPGTFIYTSDYDARQTFRQTQSHNTVHIPGYEQSQINAKLPFRVEAPSRTRVIHWQTNDIVSMIAAEVQYSGAGILHRRAVLYVSEARAWLIADRIFPEGLDARIHMMFSPGINAEEVETPFHGVHLCNDHGKSFWVCSMQVEKPKITQGWVSNAYGVRQESLQAEFCLTGKSVHYWALLPESGKNDLETRIQTLFKFWEQSNGASYIEKGSV